MEDQQAIKQFLKCLFPQFEPALQKFLSAHASLVHVQAGELMLRTGQFIKSTMLVASGRIKLYREGEDGGEFFIYYLHPGDACALTMICAAKQEKSELMGKAMEDTTVLTIPLVLMDEMVGRFKTWYYFLLDTYRSRYEELLVVIDQIAFKAMDERLFYYLQNQYKKFGLRQLRITHGQIAADLNSSREVISRLLKKLEHRGDIVLQRNFIEWKR